MARSTVQPVTLSQGTKPIPEGEALLEYDVRRRDANRRLDIVGHGARSLLCQEQRINSPMLSNVMRGRWIDPTILERVEAWLDARPEFTDGYNRPTDEDGRPLRVRVLPTPWR